MEKNYQYLTRLYTLGMTPTVSQHIKLGTAIETINKCVERGLGEQGEVYRKSIKDSGLYEPIYSVIPRKV